MTYFWIPALTFGGALLFFAAGLLAARASRLSPVRPALPVMGELTRLDPEGSDGDLQTETLDRHNALHNGHHAYVATAGGRGGQDDQSDTNADRLVALDEEDARVLFERVLSAEADARSARTELEQKTSRVEELQRDLDELSEQLLRVQRQPPLTRATPRPGTASDPGEVEAALGRERQRTQTLERELVTLQTQLVQTPEADVVAGLRRDLMVAKEQLRARQAVSDRAAAENARQKGQLGELIRARNELTRLRAENSELRARSLAAPKPKRPPPLPLAARSGPMGQTASKMGGMGGGGMGGIGKTGGLSSGQTLQAMVDELTSGEDVRAAVVADEMGLVVASSGQHSDAIAAVGAVVSRATTQVAHLLPIGTPRQVVLRDENDLTVTLRPIDAEGRSLLLLTLALGDPRDGDGPVNPTGPRGDVGSVGIIGLDPDDPEATPPPRAPLSK